MVFAYLKVAAQLVTATSPVFRMVMSPCIPEPQELSIEKEPTKFPAGTSLDSSACNDGTNPFLLFFELNNTSKSWIRMICLHILNGSKIIKRDVFREAIWK